MHLSRNFGTTCYESEVRFPTNQKLLWEAVLWTYHQTKRICKHLKIKLPRAKFIKWKKRYINYSKMRRKTKKKRNALTRALLLLLNKLNKFLNGIEKRYIFEMPKDYYKRRATIKKIHSQQYGLFHNQINPKNRIVSIAKNYLRPIVRGKEKEHYHLKKIKAKTKKTEILWIFFGIYTANALEVGRRMANQYVEKVA